MESIETLLQQTGLIRNMAPEHVEWMCAISEFVRYGKGSKVIVEDRRDRDIFIIAEGKAAVELFIPGTSDRLEPFITLRTGQLFGEFSLIDGAPRSATVSAETDLTVFKFPSDLILEKCAKDLQFGYQIMSNLASILASRVRDTTLLMRNQLL